MIGNKYFTKSVLLKSKHCMDAIKLHVNQLILDGIYVTIYWTSNDCVCDRHVDMKLHLSVGQVILFP